MALLVGETPIASRFFEGDYRGVLEATVDGAISAGAKSPDGAISAGAKSPDGAISAGAKSPDGAELDASLDHAFVIGAFAFTGRLEEARTGFDLWARSSSNPRTRAASRFFLAIAQDRAGDQAEAVALLTSTLRDKQAIADPWCRFFAYQGIGVHRYFIGDVGGAERSAGRALRAALLANFAYGRLLASDLRGHALVQRGQVRSGLSHLQQARTLAQSLGLSGNARAIATAIAVYDARFGTSGGDVVLALTSLRDDLPGSDSYSRRLVLLELALQYALRGRRREALEELDRAEMVLGPEDRRGVISLLTMRAAVQLLGGHTKLAQSLIDEARERLRLDLDAILEVDVLALVCMLQAGACDVEIARVKDHAQRRHLAQAVRFIQYRSIDESQSANDMPTKLAAAGDRMGGFMLEIADARYDRAGVADARPVIEEVCSRGLLGLLPLAFGRKPGRRIYLMPDRTVTECEGEFDDRPALVKQSRKLLTRLRDAPMTKEQLLADLWGIKNYHPVRHDAVVHTAISRTRALLGERGAWLEASDAGYGLQGGVEVVLAPSLRASRDDANEPHDDMIDSTNAGDGLAAERSEQDIRLDRIESLLQGSPKGLATSAISKAIGISDMTALRDLTAMVERGTIRREGQARATRYILVKKNPKPSP